MIIYKGVQFKFRRLRFVSCSFSAFLHRAELKFELEFERGSNSTSYREARYRLLLDSAYCRREVSSIRLAEQSEKQNST